MADTDLDSLTPCIWHRSYCSRCGMVNIALEERADSKREQCPVCGEICLVAFKGLGRTSHQVPFVERVISPLARAPLDQMCKRTFSFV
jgi:hypothetical protein